MAVSNSWVFLSNSLAKSQKFWMSNYFFQSFLLLNIFFLRRLKTYLRNYTFIAYIEMHVFNPVLEVGICNPWSWNKKIFALPLLWLTVYKVFRKNLCINSREKIFWSSNWRNINKIKILAALPLFRELNHCFKYLRVTNGRICKLTFIISYVHIFLVSK